MTPLGKYAPIVAAIVSVGLIAVYAAAILIGASGLDDLRLLAFLAAGAVFGGTATANGWKGPVMALHARLDQAGIAPAAGASSTPDPASAETVPSSTPG